MGHKLPCEFFPAKIWSRKVFESVRQLAKLMLAAITTIQEVWEGRDVDLPPQNTQYVHKDCK
jgi:hypothetical protein